MSAKTHTHLTEILDDLDLVLGRLRGAIVAFDLIADRAGLNDNSDATSAFMFTVSSARANVATAFEQTGQLHAAAKRMTGEVV